MKRSEGCTREAINAWLVFQLCLHQEFKDGENWNGNGNGRRRNRRERRKDRPTSIVLVLKQFDVIIRWLC